MKTTNLISLPCVVLMFVLSGCIVENNDKKISLINESIIMPEFDSINFDFSTDLKDLNVFIDKLYNAQWIIVIYVDSLNCIECDLDLIEWKQRVRELEKLCIDVPFLFVINAKYSSKVREIAKRDNFKYPFFFNKNNYYSSINKQLESVKFSTFLLDKEKEIIFVGNPINNPKVWQLYKEKIIGEVNKY